MVDNGIREAHSSSLKMATYLSILSTSRRLAFSLREHKLFLDKCSRPFFLFSFYASFSGGFAGTNATHILAFSIKHEAP